jgi:hypothetical protein
MPSPFPGMNPYLEQGALWQDFQLRFLPALSACLVPQVVPKYIVMLEEHLYVHELPPEPRHLLGRADPSVARAPVEPALDLALGVTEAPGRVRLLAEDVERVPYIEIRDRQGRELVTVVELLSPSNKRPGPDRDQYRTKRRELLGSRAHLVEIDLLRGGRPMPLADRPACDYSVLVSWVDGRPDAGFWPIPLRAPLPVIPVPLRAPDGEARVALQEVLHRVYDEAGYVHFLYTGAREPALTPDDAAWARQFVPPAP